MKEPTVSELCKLARAVFGEIISELKRFWDDWAGALVELWEQVRENLPNYYSYLNLPTHRFGVKSLRNLANRERHAEHQYQQRMVTAKGRGIVRRADDQ